MRTFLDSDGMVARINELRSEKNAVILTHNYQLAEVQDIADFVGDSLELSIKAARTTADVIVFCGVRFMAETAYILSPDKTVLLPSLESGCPMADMAEAPDLERFKKKHPGAIVVTYINSSAEVKALSDICVTSANAAEIVASLPKDGKIIFVPDMNLGSYVQKVTGRDMILWQGFCPTHMRIRAEDLKRRIAEFPDAKVIVHPESRPDVINLADEALSTGGMLKFARLTDARQIIVATEVGMIYRLSKESPDKQFIPVSEQAVCPNMKMHRLETVLHSLETMTHNIEIPEEIRVAAAKPITKMLQGLQS
ncbi:MAG: quinolinate synthase NadA [Victivallales bacterium]|nr:quinolinate synthase NadA [Victivallales bacterium]